MNSEQDYGSILGHLLLVVEKSLRSSTKGSDGIYTFGPLEGERVALKETFAGL